MSFRGLKRRAFSLTELMIVVLILGILAAIVVSIYSGPGTTQAAAGSSVLTQLQDIRTQLQVYQSQHNGTMPGALWLPLTSRTDVNGNIAAGNPFGPYLLMPPSNPFAVTGMDTTVQVSGTVPTSGSSSNAWLYNSVTGAILASVPSAQASALGLTTNDVATY